MPTLEELFANDPEFLRLLGREPVTPKTGLGRAKEWFQGAAAGLAPLVAKPAKAFAPEAYAEAEKILQEELNPQTAGGEWAATPSAGDVLYGAVPEEYRKGAVTGPLASIGRMAGNIFTDPLTYTTGLLGAAPKVAKFFKAGAYAPTLQKAIAAADVGQIAAAGLGYGSDIGAGVMEGARATGQGLSAAWNGQLGAGLAQAAGGAVQAGVSGALGTGLFLGGRQSVKRLKELGQPPTPRPTPSITDEEDLSRFESEGGLGSIAPPSPVEAPVQPTVNLRQTQPEELLGQVKARIAREQGRYQMDLFDPMQTANLGPRLPTELSFESPLPRPMSIEEASTIYAPPVTPATGGYNPAQMTMAPSILGAKGEAFPGAAQQPPRQPLVIPGEGRPQDLIVPESGPDTVDVMALREAAGPTNLMDAWIGASDRQLLDELAAMEPEAGLARGAGVIPPDDAMLRPSLPPPGTTTPTTVDDIAEIGRRFQAARAAAQQPPVEAPVKGQLPLFEGVVPRQLVDELAEEPVAQGALEGQMTMAPSVLGARGETFPGVPMQGVREPLVVPEERAPVDMEALRRAAEPEFADITIPRSLEFDRARIRRQAAQPPAPPPIAEEFIQPREGVTFISPERTVEAPVEAPVVAPGRVPGEQGRLFPDVEPKPLAAGEELAEGPSTPMAQKPLFEPQGAPLNAVRTAIPERPDTSRSALEMIDEASKGSYAGQKIDTKAVDRLFRFKSAEEVGTKAVASVQPNRISELLTSIETGDNILPEAKAKARKLVSNQLQSMTDDYARRLGGKLKTTTQSRQEIISLTSELEKILKEGTGAKLEVGAAGTIAASKGKKANKNLFYNEREPVKTAVEQLRQLFAAEGADKKGLIEGAADSLGDLKAELAGKLKDKAGNAVDVDEAMRFYLGAKAFGDGGQTKIKDLFGTNHSRVSRSIDAIERYQEGLTKAAVEEKPVGAPRASIDAVQARLSEALGGKTTDAAGQPIISYGKTDTGEIVGLQINPEAKLKGGEIAKINAALKALGDEGLIRPVRDVEGTYRITDLEPSEVREAAAAELGVPGLGKTGLEAAAGGKAAPEIFEKGKVGKPGETGAVSIEALVPVPLLQGIRKAGLAAEPILRRGAEFISRGITDVMEWSGRMIKEFGNGIKQFLKDIYNSVKKLVDEGFYVEEMATAAEKVVPRATRAVAELFSTLPSRMTTPNELHQRVVRAIESVVGEKKWRGTRIKDPAWRKGMDPRQLYVNIDTYPAMGPGQLGAVVESGLLKAIARGEDPVQYIKQLSPETVGYGDAYPKELEEIKKALLAAVSPHWTERIPSIVPTGPSRMVPSGTGVVPKPQTAQEAAGATIKKAVGPTVGPTAESRFESPLDALADTVEKLPTADIEVGAKLQSKPGGKLTAEQKKQFPLAVVKDTTLNTLSEGKSGVSNDALSEALKLAEGMNGLLSRAKTQSDADLVKGAFDQMGTDLEGAVTTLMQRGIATAEDVVVYRTGLAKLYKYLDDSKKALTDAIESKAPASQIADLQHEYNRARLYTMMPMGLYGNDKTRVARMLRAMGMQLDLERLPKEQLYNRTFNRLRSMGVAVVDARTMADLLAEGNIDAFSKMLLDAKPHGIHSMIQEFVVSGMLTPAGMAANAIGNLTIQALRIGAEKPVTSWLDAARVNWARKVGLGDVLGLGEREYVQAPAGMILDILGRVLPQATSDALRDIGKVILAEPLSKEPYLVGLNEATRLSGAINYTIPETKFTKTFGFAGKNLGEFIRSMPKFNTIGDNFSKKISLFSTAVNMSYTEAFRKAEKEGLRGKAAHSKAQEYVKGYLEEFLETLSHTTEEKPLKLSNWDMPRLKHALDYTKRKMMLEETFQEPTGPVAGLIKKLRGIGFWPVFPFVDTPANIAKQTVKRTPLGVPMLASKLVWLYKKHAGQVPLAERGSKVAHQKAWDAAIKEFGGWKAIEDDLAKSVVGTAASSLLVMAFSDNITGGGPLDPKEAEQLKQTGWQPYSVKLGDTYIGYNRLEPMAGILGITTDIKEAIGRGDMSAVDKATETLFSTIAENLTSKTFMQGFEGLFNAWSDPTRYMGKFLKQLESTAIPNTLGYLPVGSLARAIDPKYRQTEAFAELSGNWEQSPLLAKIPFVSETLEAQLGPMGEERARGGNALTRLFLPANVSQEQYTPVAEVAREAGRIGYTLLPPKRFQPFGVGRVKYSKQEMELFKQAHVQGIQAISQLMQDPGYQQLPDNEADPRWDYGMKTKQDVFRSIMNSYRNKVYKAVKPSVIQRGRELRIKERAEA